MTVVFIAPPPPLCVIRILIRRKLCLLLYL